MYALIYTYKSDTLKTEHTQHVQYHENRTDLRPCDRVQAHTGVQTSAPTVYLPRQPQNYTFFSLPEKKCKRCHMLRARRVGIDFITDY